MRELIDQTYLERKKICDGCEFFSENKKKTGWTTLRPDEHCTDCGCPTTAKLRCLSCNCPKNYWTEVT